MNNLNNVKKQHPNTFSDKEKEILLNHLVIKGDSCKKNFGEYVEHYVKTYGIEVVDELKKPVPPGAGFQMQLLNWRYDSHHVMWGNDNNDNLVTFVIAHPKFCISNSKLRDINKLHPDWNHKTKQGNNVLHILAAKGEINTIKQLLKDFPLDPNVKNADNEYFTHILIKPTSLKSHPNHEHRFVVKDLSYLEKVAEIFIQYPEHFEKASLNQLLEIQEGIDFLKKRAWTTVEEVNQSGNKTINMVYAREMFNKSSSQLDSFMSYFILNKTVKDEVKVSKKNKI